MPTPQSDVVKIRKDAFSSFGVIANTEINNQNTPKTPKITSLVEVLIHHMPRTTRVLVYII